jgi:cytochrome c-type biogenesis protein CcmH
MALWFVLALMTAAAMFAVLWPLARRARSAQPAAGDVAVYRDQLDELARDRAAGLIAEAEAHAARAEIARRLIAAADAGEAAAADAPRSPRWRRRAVMLAALTVLPFGAAALYLFLGAPHLPGAPLAARLDAPAQERSIDSLVVQVEAYLQHNPEDGRGWDVLAPVYMRLGRFEDAVAARRNALRLNGADAGREADLGEALTAAANGIVTQEAKAAFERALKQDPGEVKARYFVGLAAEQDGKSAEAAAVWRGLLASAPAQAPWTEPVRRSLARVDSASGIGLAGPSVEDMAAAANLPPDERATMVRGMVARLAARLQQDGSDLEGWLRLMRAYTVLGEPEKAKTAAADARRALTDHADKLRRVDELAKTLGLES